MAIRLHLLPWDQPLLKRAVDWLAGDWRGAGPLDLSETLVVVSTRQSGRRLREALAVRAAARGQAVFSPQVMLPEGLVSRGPLAAEAASPLESRLAWIEVLRSLDLAEFREVFPRDPPRRDFAWALRLSGEFVRLQKTLGEAGLGMADVSARGGEDMPEIERWRQLTELERLHSGRLAAKGKRGAQVVRSAMAQDPSPPPGVTRVVLLAVPDVLPAALAALGMLSRALPVDIVVYGPPGEESLFDEWGRPRSEAWGSRNLALPDFERRVRLCEDPLAQAEQVAACARRYSSPEGWLAVGVADSDVLPFLENSLARAGAAAYNPEGRPRRREGLFALLQSMAALSRPGDPAFADMATLARCPDVLEWLGMPAARLLAVLDELHRRHLPASLDVAQVFAGRMAAEFPELVPALAKFVALHSMLTTGTFSESAETALAAIFSARQINLAGPSGARLADSMESWGKILRQAAGTAPRSGPLETGAWWELALQLFGDERQDEEKPTSAVELQGWLELLWEDAPHLMVVGCNDGRLPESVVGDPFLPEALRERLGLKTNAARFARDAYILQALVEGRTSAGRLDLLFGKVSAAGDPLRPSRLLLRCADAELPRRIAFLFRPANVARATHPWQRAWRLRPRRRPSPTQLEVTAFRDYLRCPFRFHLGRVLGMTAVDPDKSEMDAADFGNLCHAALEAMGRETALRDCTEPKMLREFLLAELERIVRARYATELTLPLVVQVESARQRLARAAEVQARERAAGWTIQEVEWRFPAEPPFVLGGLPVRGTIDRIDRHEITGAWRVLDYKTSDRPVTPREAHCRAARRATPAWARFAMAGREFEWTDLQLPLYREATAREAPDAVCGYFLLPKAVGGTTVEIWKDYSPAWHAAALRCAKTVAEEIRNRRCWPPSEVVTHDEFADLFHHGVTASVDGEALGAAESGGTRR